MRYHMTNEIRANLEAAVDAFSDDGMVSESERTDVMNFINQFPTDEEELHVR